MSNLHLFELINAAAGLDGWWLLAMRALAEAVIYLVPLAMAWAWVRGNHTARRELLQMLLAAALALGLALLVAQVWPQARPFTLHVGNQYLAHANDPGLPSDHVTVFWSLGFAAFMTRRFELFAMPLLAVGLVVGWSRVYLGVHFPFDVLGALPVAVLGAAIAGGLRRPCRPAVARLLYLYHRLERWLRARSSPIHKA